MHIRLRPLWTVSVEHGFFGGACDALAFTVPPATQRVLAGWRAMAREHDGRLAVLLELGEDGQPMVPPAALLGRTLHFGLQPRSAAFDTYTAPHGAPRGQRPWWNNAANAARVAAAPPLTLAGERVLPRPPGNLLVDDDLAADPPWGLLSLTLTQAHLDSATGQDFTLAFDARSDILRYYVVASPGDADVLTVEDAGFTADKRAQIAFERKLPPFAAPRLSAELLGANDSTKVVLFEAPAPTARRRRGPTGITLKKNDEVIVTHLPVPGAERADAQFVVHVNKP